MIDPEVLKSCEKIIHMFVAVLDPSKKLKAEFREWVIDERHWEEKDRVMRQIFSEITGWDITAETDCETADALSHTQSPDDI